jgi:hypothetical protein
MPSDNFKLLMQGKQTNLAAGHASTLYDVPDNHEAIIKQITVVNSDVAARWFQGFVTTGTTYDINTAITPALTIPAGGMAVFDGTITLVADSKLAWDVETVDVITISVFGDEIDVS